MPQRDPIKLDTPVYLFPLYLIVECYIPSNELFRHVEPPKWAVRRSPYTQKPGKEVWVSRELRACDETEPTSLPVSFRSWNRVGHPLQMFPAPGLGRHHFFAFFFHEAPSLPAEAPTGLVWLLPPLFEMQQRLVMDAQVQYKGELTRKIAR